MSKTVKNVVNKEFEVVFSYFVDGDEMKESVTFFAESKASASILAKKYARENNRKYILNFREKHKNKR